MGKLGRLGLEPAVRYERERPGELIHIDVKKLGRIQGGAGKRVTGKLRHNWERSDRSGTRRKMVGWEFVHIAIDDCTRLAYAEVLGDEKATTVVAFLYRAVAFFQRHGMREGQCRAVAAQSNRVSEARWPHGHCGHAGDDRLDRVGCCQTVATDRPVPWARPPGS
jgi:hypothetical protein